MSRGADSVREPRRKSRVDLAPKPRRDCEPVRSLYARHPTSARSAGCRRPEKGWFSGHFGHFPSSRERGERRLLPLEREYPQAAWPQARRRRREGERRAPFSLGRAGFCIGAAEVDRAGNRAATDEIGATGRVGRRRPIEFASPVDSVTPDDLRARQCSGCLARAARLTSGAEPWRKVSRPWKTRPFRRASPPSAEIGFRGAVREIRSMQSPTREVES
jgi:hypothetical protein